MYKIKIVPLDSSLLVSEIYCEAHSIKDSLLTLSKVSERNGIFYKNETMVIYNMSCIRNISISIL